MQALQSLFILVVQFLEMEEEELLPVFEDTFLEITGAKAAVMQEIAINEISNSIKENARWCFGLV